MFSAPQLKRDPLGGNATSLDNQDSHLRASFVRQRRNLLVASLLLLAFLSTGAELSHLNVFGNQIDLKRPLLVSWPLWIAWAYLLWRYYQHLRDLGDLGIRTAWVYRLHNLIGESAKRSFMRSFHPGDPYGKDVKSTFTFGDVGVTDYRYDVWIITIKGTASYHEGNPVSRSGHEPIDEMISVPVRTVRWLRVRAGWWVLFHTRLLTEYAQPFVVAAFPPVLWAAEHWLGLSLAA